MVVNRELGFCISGCPHSGVPLYCMYWCEGDSEGNSDVMVSCAVFGECAGQNSRSSVKILP